MLLLLCVGASCLNHLTPVPLEHNLPAGRFLSFSITASALLSTQLGQVHPLRPNEQICGFSGLSWAVSSFLHHISTLK